VWHKQSNKEVSAISNLLVYPWAHTVVVSVSLDGTLLVRFGVCGCLAHHQGIVRPLLELSLLQQEIGFRVVQAQDLQLIPVWLLERS
jgi:hypothetical protein